MYLGRLLFRRDMKLHAIGFLILTGLWVISHFHYYYIQCSFQNLGIDMFLVHGSFWTDVRYSVSDYSFGEGPLFVAVEKEEYEPTASETGAPTPQMLKPSVIETLLGATVFKSHSGHPNYFVSFSMSIWLILLVWCIALVSHRRIKQQS